MEQGGAEGEQTLLLLEMPAAYSIYESETRWNQLTLSVEHGGTASL